MEYLLSRTGKSLVDPTGRSTVPMFPSQETKILDHTFGTGKNSRKTEAQRRELIRDLAKLPANETVAEDLGEFGRLIPKLRSVDDSSVARKKKDDGGDGGGGALKTLQGLLPPDEAPPGEAVNASQAKLAGEVAQAGAGDQKFGFVNLSAEVDVQPNDGFGVLLPRESRTVDVIFKPVSAVNVDLNLTMRTTMNNTYAIKVRGRGLEPALKFSFTVLKFPPASPGDRVVASVLVSHPSAPGAKREAAPRTFELVVPKPLLSFLTVQPAVATVAPGETRRVEISFAPPRSSSRATCRTCKIIAGNVWVHRQCGLRAGPAR